MVGAWAAKEPIDIAPYSKTDFFELLKFFYLGRCKIDDDNVIALVDLAEYYDVELLKDKCDRFLAGSHLSIDNIIELYESVKPYSLKTTCDKLEKFIQANSKKLIESGEFVRMKKDMLMDIVQMEWLKVSEEDLFEAVSFLHIFGGVSMVYVKEESFQKH